MTLKVIVILGLPLSGKTVHAKVVQEELNIPLYETGTYVYKAVAERGLDATPENIVMVAGECKSQSDAYFTEKALEEAVSREKPGSMIFMSGVKAQSEVDHIISKVGKDNFFMISFHASADTRHSRLLNKDRQTESNARGSKGVEDQAMADDRSRFNMRDDKELGYGLGRLMALAHYVVNTEDRLWPHHNFDITINQFKGILNDVKNK
ncbi:MAG: AAA family ATPase [Candidatus Heimdallarchaeota archaeon]|nr:AAA family ATPase [Candidatus Heimdallarchaeota archaeon]